MKRYLAPLAARLGAVRTLRRRSRERLRILMYHGVVEAPLEPFCWHQLPLRAFEAQLRWVNEYFTVLPLSEALERLASDTLPPHACAITFDDGYRNNVTLAAPLLDELGCGATVFVPTDLVGSEDLLWPDRVYVAFAAARARFLDAGDVGLGRLSLHDSAQRGKACERVLHVLKSLPMAQKDRFLDALAERLAVDPAEARLRAQPFRLLTWDEIQRADECGPLSFGPHSTTHEILSRCEDAEVVRQVERSRASVAAHTSRVPRVFAYPNGREEDFDARARSAVRDAGMPWALSTSSGLNGSSHDPLALRRISIGADLGMSTFQLLVSGWGDVSETHRVPTSR